MKKFARVLAVIMIVVFAVTAFAACGKGDKNSDGSTSKVKIIEINLTEEEYAFGVDKSQPELLAKVNAFIAEIKENGKFDEICNRYFGDGTPIAVKSAELDTSKDQLVVATNAAFEPFEYTPNGGEDYYGIDMEIAAALAEYLGQELVIQNMKFESVCLSVGQHQCDIAMAGLTIKPSRKEYVTFTDSYYSASQKLIVTSDNTDFDACKTKEDVEKILNTYNKDVKIGVQAGTTAQFYLEGDPKWDPPFPGFAVTCTPYENGALAVQDLVNGGVQAVVLDSAPAECITKAINSMGFNDKINRFMEVLVEQKGYVKVVEGLKNTLKIAVLGLVIGIVIGTLIAIVRVLPKYRVLPRFLNTICSGYVALFRGTPMVVQLLVFYYVVLPLLEIRLPSITVSIIVFGLNSGAYISEIMRSGIQSVDYGQMEGGRSVGLSFSTTMLKIVIPQAIKNILPTLGNEFIVLIKETSIVSFVGAADLYVAFNYIGSNNYEFMVPYLTMALIYIVLVCVITLLVKIMERSLKKSDRRN